MVISVKYDLNHFLVMPLMIGNKGIFYLLSTIKVCFPYQSFGIKYFYFLALKGDQLLCFEIRQ